MPVTQVQTPDGKLIDIQHPDGAAEQDILSYASQQYALDPSAAYSQETSLFDDVVEFGQRTLGSAATQLAQVPSGLQERFFGEEGFDEDDKALVERNRRAAQSISEFFGYDEGYEDGAVGFLSGAIGGALPSYGPALAGVGAGFLIGGPVGALVGAGAGILGGATIGSGANVSAGMEATARALEMGRSVSDEDYETAMRNQALIGASEGLPIGRLAVGAFRSLSKAAAKDPKAVKTITDYLVSALKQGTLEGAQEALAGLASNANLKEYINPDIDITDSLASDLGAGGVAGAFFDVALNLATRKSRLSGLDSPDEVKPLREELVAAEEELRDGIDNNETARRERLSERLAVPVEAEPEIIGDSLNTLLNQEELSASDYKAFGQSVVAQMGDSFPTEPVFEIVENDNNTFQIQDPSGQAYGRAVTPQEKIKLQPALVALNAQTVEESIFQNNRIVINESSEDYSPDQVRTLHRLGRIALGPESLSYSAEAANYAGGTVPEKGFLPTLSPEEIIKNSIPRKQQTIAQRINVRRLKNNQPTTNRFALSEIRREIGSDVGRLADYESGTFRVNTFRALPFPVEGKFAVIPEAMNVDGQMEPAGDYIFDRPATAAERQAAREQGKRPPKRVKFTSVADASDYAGESNRAKDEARIPIKEIMGDPEFSVEKIRRILDQKNISSDINSPEIKHLAARFTGNKLRRDQGIHDLTPAEGQLLYLKLSQLPRFAQPTKIPQFKLRPYTASQIATATDYYQANGKDINRAELEYTSGKPLTDAAYKEVTSRARRTSPEGQVEQEPIAALPPPSIAPDTKKMLSDAVNRRLKALGLPDISGVVTDLVRNVERDADGNVYLNNVAEGADERVEGGYQRSGAKTIQVALDAIMSRANKPEDIESAVIDVLNHEIVHALRELDVITQQELQLLERLATKYRKTDTNQTYMEWATETYAGDTAVNISEEAVAEMIRDGISGRIIIDNKSAKLTGKPRSIFNRIVKFFKGLFNTAKEADPDYESFTQFITDLESGAIGERQRGQVRTLYRLEQISGQFINRRAPVVATASGSTPEKLEVLKEKIPESDSLMEEAGIDDMMFSRRLDRADEQGYDTSTPYYHGTASPDIRRFRTEIPHAKGIIAGHFTTDPKFANTFVPVVAREGEAQTVYPVFLRAKNTFDPRDKKMVSLVMADIDRGADGQGHKLIVDNLLSTSRLDLTEPDAISFADSVTDKIGKKVRATPLTKFTFEDLETISPFIKAAGFDSYLDFEGGTGKDVTGIAVFNPADIKGVFAEYDPTAVPEGMRYEDDIMFSRRTDLPPPENAQRTQISGTLPTYRKAADILDREGSGDRYLDFGAGLGLGAKELGYDSYEPFPRKDFSPTYTEPDQISPRSYDKILNLNVLNVVPRDARDRIVRDIGTALDAGGVAVITTRGKEVLSAQGNLGPEATSIITTRGTYQKGFSRRELVDYVRGALGPEFEVSSLNLGPAGVLVRRVGIDDMMFSRRADMKHGIPKEYIVSSRGQVSGKPALPKAINPKNGEAQAQKLAELAERHPDPLSSKAAWLRFERDLMGDNETPSAPTGLIRLYDDIDAWVERHKELTPEQLAAAGEGFELVEDMSQAYANGDATVDTTGKLMLWGILSRMLSAHPHESAFLDAAIDKKLSEFIGRAVEREWTQADIDEYLQWTDTVIPDFAPSKQGTSNLRAFGKTFLPKMSKRTPSGKSALEELHDLIADKSVPTSDIRARYYGLNQGMGIQNKVLSFILLMTGRKDVVVLDRIQINSMWDAGRFGRLIYDDIASLFEGAHGLARYEALERSLANKIQDLYDGVGRPDDASVGRYHWESWVRDSGQVVSHPTIQGLISETKGDRSLAESYADIGAPEGRFHQFAFGSVYARDADGTPYIMYADSSGTPHRFGLERFKEFLAYIKKPANGVIPSQFSVKSYREAGYPWYQSEEVNRERLDQIIQDFSEGTTTTEAAVSDAVESEGDADVTGQRPSDANILSEDQVAFSRRASDRNVERSSQNALDQVIKYAESVELDPAGAATLEQGPIAFSVNAGFADQNGYAPSFTTPSRSWFDRVVFQVQDKLTDLKAIEEAINEARKARGEPPLAVQASAYIGEETIPGKLGELDRRFQRNELQPLVDDMSESGVSLDQMDEFLVFRHAIERNERVRNINPSIPDAGSGEWNGQRLTDDYVKKQMLNKYGMRWNDKKGEWEGGNDAGRLMSRLASKVDKINSTTLAISERGGLLTKQDREFLDGFFKYYTPLRGISQDEDIAAETNKGTAGSGGSLSIVGKEVKRLMGRQTEAISPLATIISDRGRQTARSVKNVSFGKRLVELIKNNPNDEVWQLISPDDPQYRRAFDTSYTYVGPDKSRYGERKSDISKENDKKNWVKRVRVIQDPVINPYGKELLGVKVDGQQYYVHFANPSLRKAAINLDAESVGFLVERLNGFTRFMSYVNTSLNPEFVMGNFARDVQTAIYNIIGEQTMEGGKAVNAKKIVGQVLKRTIPSIKVFYKGYRDPSNLTGQDAIDFREFMQTGAKTDWFHSKPPEQQKKNIERMVDMANGTFSGNATQGLVAVKDFIDDTNSAVENGVRLATFVAARDAMLAKGIDGDTALQEAATLAKNLTVNFNRRGNSGQLLNGLYLFFNASVQGTVNTMRGLNVFNPDSSRTKQAVVGGIVGFGALMAALAESLMDEEEFDDIPEYIRDRNMIIPDALWGGDPKTYSTIPLPYGYNVFYNLGENAYLVSSGALSKEDAAVRATNVFLGSFNPLGTSSSETYIGSLLKTATPQILKPALELTMNENYFGAPIYPPDNPFGGFSEPLSRRSFKNTASLWKNISEGVSTFFGGNESEAGAIEFPPDAMSYLVGYFGGGAGTFAERTFLKVPSALLDETAELEVRDIPFVRRIRGEINAQPDTEQYYERRETLTAKLNQANKVLRGAERAAYIKENRPFFNMMPNSKATEKALKSLRASLRAIQKLKAISPDRAVELAQQEKHLQDRIDRVIERFNDRYDEVVGKNK